MMKVLKRKKHQNQKPGNQRKFYLITLQMFLLKTSVGLYVI